MREKGLKTKKFCVVTVLLLVVTVGFGLTKGNFTYKDQNQEVVIAIDSRDAETVSAVLAFISALLAVKETSKMY